jgi:hypothetical protein
METSIPEHPAMRPERRIEEFCKGDALEIFIIAVEIFWRIGISSTAANLEDRQKGNRDWTRPFLSCHANPTSHRPF